MTWPDALVIIGALAVMLAFFAFVLWHDARRH